VSYPSDLKYTDSHEWIRVEGDVATIGISHYAQDSLGDVVFVDLPEVGDDAEVGAQAAEVESTKSVSPIYAPVSGEVVGINEDLSDEENCVQVNQDPYGAGWMFKIRLSDAGQIEGMKDAAAYQA
jgi:glycine cleavage system H protein